MLFKDRGQALVSLLLLLLFVLGGPLAPAARAQGAPQPTTYVATLLGRKEVPPNNSQASGVAIAVLSADERTLTVSVNYANLSATTAYIHGPADSGVIAQILFNLPRSPFTNQVIPIVPRGELTAEDIVDALNAGRLYVNISSANYPGGEIRGNFYRVSGSDPGSDPEPTPDRPSTADAVRFLEQATFGPTGADIEHVKSVGLRAFLAEQFAAPMSGYREIPYANNNYNAVKQRFFQNAVRNPDQLRQRVAFALSQILVVSGLSSDIPGTEKLPAMQLYQEVLHQNALGNYRQLLEDITLNPAMGAYLNMVNNAKAVTNSQGQVVQPNENFSRELLQLFSIGVFQLNLDGTLQLDGEFKPIPTYGNEEVKEFARALTGWTYAPQWGRAMALRNLPNFYAPMIPAVVGNQNNHDTGAKTLLNNVVLPAGQDARADLEGVLDNVFHHANVGPFLATRLIQNLVTSNPSPGYVRRVASAFNDNGQGVRGDMKAVVSAVLLDPEARGDRKSDPNYGKLREPALFITNLLRALGATGDLSGIRDLSRFAGQDILTSPTVFNFYQPDYRVNYGDLSLLAPEVQTLTTDTQIRRINFVNSLVFATIGGVTVNLSEWEALANDTTVLLNELDQHFLHGTMSAQMRQIISDAIAAVPATQPRRRAQTALYLVASSIPYQVQR